MLTRTSLETLNMLLRFVYLLSFLLSYFFFIPFAFYAFMDFGKKREDKY
jgi:hypothetical protein